MTVAKSWAVLQTKDERQIHVLPKDPPADDPQHVFGANCWCHPDLELRKRTKNQARVTVIVHQCEDDDGA